MNLTHFILSIVMFEGENPTFVILVRKNMYTQKTNKL